jgi:hypothetical protein
MGGFFDYLDKRETKNKKVTEVKKVEKIVENKVEEKQVIKEDSLVNHVNLILGGTTFEPGKIKLSEGNDIDHINQILG